MLYLRQICLVARDLQPVIEDLEAVLGVERCYVDPDVAAFGLENTLLAVGSQFIEVVAPIRSGVAAERFLERRGGDGGYMVICQVATREEQAACRARAGKAGVRVAFEHNVEEWRVMQLHPGDMRAAFLEVDWQTPSDVEGHWRPAGGEGWRKPVVHGAAQAIRAVELQGEDPEALAAHWSSVIGASVTPLDGHPSIRLANAALRFVEARDGRGAGLGGVDLAIAEPGAALERAERRGLASRDDHVNICGARFRFIL